MKFTAPIFTSIVFLGALVACSADERSTTKRGELILVIDSDMTPGQDFDRFQIEVRQQGATPDKKTFQEFGQPGQEVHFPATYTIVSNDKTDTRIQVRVVTGKVGPGGNNEVGVPQNLVEFVTAIPTNRSAMMRVRLEWLCRASTKLEEDGYVEGTCKEGEACVAGRCEDWNVDLGDLPTYSDAEAFGGGGGSGNGKCFDSVDCLSGAKAVTLDANCTFSDDDEANLNVALVPEKGFGGICSGETCFVPLDRGAPHGWASEGGRIQVPARVCEILKKPEEKLKLRGVVASHRCASKTPALPTCGPWSTITTNRGAKTMDPFVGLP